MPPLLNARHDLFARERAAGRTQREAAQMAGISEHAGPRVDRQPDVQARIAELADEAERARKIVVAMAVQKAGVSKAWILDKLKQNVERAMQVEPVTDSEGNQTGVYTYQGAVANKALELLGKEIGMFRDRVQIDVDRPRFEDMSDDELAEYVARRSRELGDGARDITPPSQIPGGRRQIN